jgi:uncharacterized protein
MFAFLIFIFVLLLFDLYAFKGIAAVSSGITNKRIKTTIYLIFWLIPAILIVLSLAVYLIKQVGPPAYYNRYYIIVGLFILFYIPKSVFVVFHLLEDILRQLFILLKKISQRIDLCCFFNKRFISKAGLILSVLPFVLIIYGKTLGRFNFRIVEETIEFRHLPEEFEGFRIVQFSDIHIGSLYGQQKKVEQAIEMMNSANPDIVLFTGDLVNNFSGELSGWDTVFMKIQAKQGKYAVLGNHDYGDYSSWDSVELKKKNFEEIKDFFDRVSFRLLNNENKIFRIGHDSIAIIGVENWGSPPFSQYGDLQKALSGVKEVPFKILLSHDPSQWDEEVKEYTDIAMTFSGHTHGMQFGIETSRIKWSPIQMKYPRWGGLYKEGDQYLYVNRGLGYIGFPGRIGMPPEITVITLVKSK